ncbi:Arabinanase/levansucrase/invertase [Decorospora gaudefroyi]|uniref:Arabinanase/levansucrase/invertase n=1 Tax=Decorospora gaudefroyi TaxID=184978 RepID=A0A6A5JXK8_9PLEO|nr:Arabinanase/levansucrase/invertase [Decorospora gaudefroyi]
MKSFHFIVTYALWVYSTLVSGAKFSNPLKDPNGSDPHMVYDNGYYYLMTTTWTDLYITRATTLEGLKRGEVKKIWTGGYWVWAPEMHKIDGRWHVYFTENYGPYVLRGGGSPWDAYGSLTRITPGWGIDGTVLNVPNYGRYYVYSCLANDLQSLCIAPLTSPTTIGTIKTLSQPTKSWEKVGNPVMEAPVGLYHGGRLWIVYSASSCHTTSYSLALLTYDGRSDPMQPSSWTKSANPVFTSANGNYGTGHNGFFTSPDGKEIWNVYHATKNSNGNCGNDRQTFAQIVNWNADGTPNFGVSAARGTVMNGPSGE